MARELGAVVSMAAEEASKMAAVQDLAAVVADRRSSAVLCC